MTLTEAQRALGSAAVAWVHAQRLGLPAYEAEARLAQYRAAAHQLYEVIESGGGLSAWVPLSDPISVDHTERNGAED